MTAPAPLPDTERLIDWGELPERARDIPDDFDPTREGVLMAHQTAWIRTQQGLDIAVCEKGRRTGITFAQALDDTITAATAKDAGGDNIWYMADTREKGLEYIGYVGKFARVVARGTATAIEQHIFYDQTPEGDSREIQAFRVRFASGHRVTALSSRPENIHGLQGRVNIDEAALHKNVRSVLESATALLIWGGRIRVWSTHRGKANAFNELLMDVRAGRYGGKAAAIRITFDDAVENGLYERVCAMQRRPVTAEGKRDWYAAIRSAYGPRQAAMREELDAIPRDGSGTAIPTVWIERAMPEVRPLLRLHHGDDFPRLSEEHRKSVTQAWVERELGPLVRALVAAIPAGTGRVAVGMDYARHRHFSAIIPAIVGGDLRRTVPFVLELNNVPTRQQEQVLWYLLDALRDSRRPWTFAGDASGPGQTLMEYTADRYGAALPHPDRPDDYIGGPVHQVVLSRAWYGAHMPRYIALFEDGFITLPRDANIEEDHRAVEFVDGIPMLPKLERADLKEPELVRHGDTAIAGALMEFAAAHPVWAPDLNAIEHAGLTIPAGLGLMPGGVVPLTRAGWGGVPSGLPDY